LLPITLSNGHKLVAGKTVCGFTNDEEAGAGLTDAMPFLLETALIESGATFAGAAKWQANVQISERLLTGQNPASASPLGEALVAALGN
jgi:putative intracellular protease/amidase